MDNLDSLSRVILHKIKCCINASQIIGNQKEFVDLKGKEILNNKIRILRDKRKVFEEVLFEIKKLETNKSLSKKCLTD